MKTRKLIVSVIMMACLLAACESQEKNTDHKNDTQISKTTDKTETYPITYIDQESSSGGVNNVKTVDVIGYMKNDNEYQMRIDTYYGEPTANIKYATTILTNPDEAPTVTLTRNSKKTVTKVDVKRQPYQRYMQPEVSGTVVNKEETK